MNVPASNGPEYPLSREEFLRALSTGHGRARIHVERFGAADFRDEILAAASVCKVYDPECEGTRGDWLAELCLAAGVEREVVELPVPGDHWERNHRAALLKELALRGVAGAREALYACFGPVEHSGDFHASEEIIELDGEAGLLFFARSVGAELAQSPASTISGYELSVLDERHGEGAGRRLLDSAARSDARIRAYLDAVDREELEAGQRSSRPERQRPSIGQVLEAIRRASERQGTIWAPALGRTASREELQQVIHLLLELDAPRPIHHALWHLGMATMLPLHPRIFELTRHEDEQVRYWAARVLSKHSLPGVRSCGLEALARGDLVVALEILTRSAQVDDVEALVAALRPIDDPHKEHAVGSGILDLFEHSPEVRDPRLALHVYERTPCMNCRENAVEFLVCRREAPAWLLEECARDASAEIRALASGRRADS
jgi:hypothetical protein